MHVDSAEGLVEAYGNASTNARNAMNALSPLVTEAYDLLGMAGQNGLTGPIPALMNLANDMSTEQRDVAWRVDWLKSNDALPLGLSGRVQGTVPADLNAAFAQTGLTPEEAELVQEMLNDGVSFNDAVAAAQSDDPEAMLDAMRLAELNNAIANWNGTDNDPILDALLRDRNELAYAQFESGESLAPVVLAQLLLTLSPAQLLEAERDNHGTIDIAFLDAIVNNHDATVFPDDPLDPMVERAREIRDLLVVDIAGDTDGHPDPTIAAIAQRNDITYEQAQLAFDVNEIDRLNDQSLSIPSLQGSATARQQRDAEILEFVGGNVDLAASIARFMSQGHTFTEASQFAVEEISRALDAYNQTNPAAEESQEDDRGFWGDVQANIFGSESVVGALITGDYVTAAGAIGEHGPGVASTVGNAVDEIATLSPFTPQGLELLLTDPQQFIDIQQNFAGGVWDWTVDTGKLVGALAIAGNPVINAQVEQHTGRNIQQELSLIHISEPTRPY